MSVFTNRHVLVALLVAPLLALIAYFAVDLVVAEKPRQAQAGASYPLAAKSNCRYHSGRCRLVNGDVSIELTVQGQRLVLSPNHAASGIRLAIVANGQEQHLPVAAVVGQQQWQADLPTTFFERSLLRVAARIGAAKYFAETSAIFMQPEGE